MTEVEELEGQEREFWDSPAGRIYAPPKVRIEREKGDVVIHLLGRSRLILTADGRLVLEGANKLVEALKRKLRVLE